MPQLVRLYIASVAIGLALAAVFTGALIVLDVARLGHLVLNAQGGWLAGALLVIFNGIVFAGVQCAIRVMALGDRREPPQSGLGAEPAPVPIGAEAPVRRMRSR